MKNGDHVIKRKLISIKILFLLKIEKSGNTMINTDILTNIKPYSLGNLLYIYIYLNIYS